MVHFPRSRLRTLCIQARMTGHYARRVTPFGNLRISGCMLLPAAFRSLPRPSSPDSSEASTMNPYSLDHILVVHPRNRFSRRPWVSHTHTHSLQRPPVSGGCRCRPCVRFFQALIRFLSVLFEPACLLSNFHASLFPAKRDCLSRCWLPA